MILGTAMDMEKVLEGVGYAVTSRWPHCCQDPQIGLLFLSGGVEVSSLTAALSASAD